MNRSNDGKYLASLKKRYVKASQKERGQILDEYVQTTGYHRKYAAAVLSGQVQRAQRPIHRPRHTLYRVEDARALDTISDIFDEINAKVRPASTGCALGMDAGVPSLALAPSPARCSRARSRFAPGQTGTRAVQALSRSTGSVTMAATCAAMTA
jgi:hypothetical protein